MKNVLFGKSELQEIKETLQVIKNFINNLQESNPDILSEIDDLLGAFTHLENIQIQNLSQGINGSSLSSLQTSSSSSSLLSTSTTTTTSSSFTFSVLEELEELEELEGHDKQEKKREEAKLSLSSLPLSLETFNQFLAKIRAQEQKKIGIGRNRDGFEGIDFFLYPSDQQDFPELISRVHAEIFFSENEFFIRDCNSTHGTFVNGYRLQNNEYVSFVSGDTVKFARSRVFTFVPVLFRLKEPLSLK